MPGFNNQDELAATISIPVKVVRGKIVYFYNGQLPKFEEGTVGDLIMPEYSVKDADWLEPIVTSLSVPLLPSDSQLLIAVNGLRVPAGFKDETITLESKEVGHLRDEMSYRFVPVKLLDPLFLVLRGTKKAVLAACRCELSKLGTKARSLNHAYSLASIKYEPDRLAHTGNAFERVYYRDHEANKWFKLQHRRGIEEARYEQERLLTQKQQPKKEIKPAQLSFTD